MKVSIVALALMLSSLASANAVTIKQQAQNYFFDADGNTGFVVVTRIIDPVTKVRTTSLIYSFCAQTTAASCLEGFGPVPNNVFTGVLDGNSNKAETVRLLVDTTIPGFTNQLCNGPDPYVGGCQSTSPATGGLISLSYLTKPGTINILTFDDYQLDNFKITQNSRDRFLGGPASVLGTVIGTSANNTGASWGIENLSGKGAFGPAQQAQSQLAFEKSLGPQTRVRLQRLTGEKPAQ